MFNTLFYKILISNEFLLGVGVYYFFVEKVEHGLEK